MESIVLADQCTVWRQKIYKRQNHLYTKDKSDEADKKRSQQQGDNLLRNSPLIKLQGKANFLPWFGGVNELVDKLPKTCDEMLLYMTIKESMVNSIDIHNIKSIYTLAALIKYVYGRYASDMNIIQNAMRPILNLLPPTGDVKAIKNIDTILTIIDTIKLAGPMDRITLNMLQVIESKAVAANKMDEYLNE